MAGVPKVVTHLMNTRPEPLDATEVNTDPPGPVARALNTVVWYTPELTAAAITAGAAAAVWAPLGVLTAACGARIATDQINRARTRRRFRRELENERERAQRQLDHDNHDNHGGDDTAAAADGDSTGEVA